MSVDLKSMTRKQLEKLRRDVDKALEKIEETEKRAAFAAAEKAAKDHGYTLSELSGMKSTAKGAKDGRSTVAPKFKNPADDSQTWTGRGRKPKWVEAHLADGGKLEDLAI